MALPNLKNGFKARAAAVGLTAAVALTPLVGTFAQDANGLQGAAVQNATYEATPVIYENIADAGLAATEYALENDAIGIIIGYGPYDGAPPPEAFGKRFQEEIAKLGEESQYFIGIIPAEGYAVTFGFGRTTEGPMAPRDAAQNLQEIVDIKRFEREMFASLGPRESFASLEANNVE